MTNWYRKAAGSLLAKLEDLRPGLAAAAQNVYDGWQQDEDGIDEILGGGEICQDIAEAMADVIASAGINTYIMEAQGGEQHVWVLAYDRSSGCHVDINPNAYETGGGYSWKKIQDIEFDETDVEIWTSESEIVKNIIDEDGAS